MHHTQTQISGFIITMGIYRYVKRLLEPTVTEQKQNCFYIAHLSFRLAAKATLAPFSARALDTASPIPLDAPVTMTTLS